MQGDSENLSSDSGGPTPELSALLPAPPPAPRDIWTLGDLLLFITFIPFAYLVADLLALIGYSVLRPFAGWHATADAAQNSTVFLLVMQFLFYTFILTFLFVASTIRHRQPFWKSLGWQKPSGKQAVRWLLGGGGLAVLAGLALSIRPDTRSFPLEEMFTSRAATIALAVFAVGIAPVVEEVVFRGLLFAVCERTVGIYLAVIITAVLFATLHIPEYLPAWNHVVIIFVVGLVFSFTRARTGALAPSIFLHIGYNSLMIVGFFFSK
jgi:membrane protease YdiL (CAAX protease family)